MKFLIGLGLALIAAFGGWLCYSRMNEMNGIPVRSATVLADIAPNTKVVVYGGLWAGDGDGLQVFVSETERCTTSIRTIGKQVSTSTSCHWDETGRNTPQFDVICDNAPVHISNQGYSITGANRYQETGWRTRLRGFSNGDGVLAIGVSTKNGIQASEIYGGTLAQYVSGLRFWMWAWIVISGICFVGGIVAEVLAV